ncbi:MAG: RidA family protein [Myxococcales bacterium]|nr:RidA family protein [Myxococcales bacterium]
MKKPSSSVLPHSPVFSWYRSHEGLIFTSGHAAIDVDSYRPVRVGFEEEVRLTLDNLTRTLEHAGSGLDKVLKITAYIVDMKRYPDFNRIYATYFPGENPPARTCVEVRRLPFDFQVEIEAIAHG